LAGYLGREPLLDYLRDVTPFGEVRNSLSPRNLPVNSSDNGMERRPDLFYVALGTTSMGEGFWRSTAIHMEAPGINIEEA